MGLKRALFYGGAILVLGACSDATAPKTQLQTRTGVPSAAAKTRPKTPVATTLDDCRGFFITSGDKLVCVDDIPPLP